MISVWSVVLLYFTYKGLFVAFNYRRQDGRSSVQYVDPTAAASLANYGGNFLIITYRELRLLEIEVLRERLAREGVRPATTAQLDKPQDREMTLDDLLIPREGEKQPR